MRVACVHTFTIAAEDRDEYTRILDDLHRRIARASEKLGIGYERGFMVGQPQAAAHVDRARLHSA